MFETIGVKIDDLKESLAISQWCYRRTFVKSSIFSELECFSFLLGIQAKFKENETTIVSPKVYDETWNNSQEI